MLRSCRFIILAIAGLILLTGAQQPAKQSETTKSNKQTKNTTSEATAPAKTPEPTYRAYPDKYADSCYNAKDHNSADLCAQWRAAIAAEKAAKEAARATDWAIIATLLSFLGVSGLIYTIWQTHGALRAAREGNRITMKANARATRQAVAGAADTAKALEIAAQNAAAATAQVEVAQRTSDAQLMPYVYVERIVSKDFDPCDSNILIRLKNFGQTPATNVKAAATFRRCATGQAISAKIDLSRAVASADIPPGHTQTIRTPIDVEDWPGTIDRVLDETIIIVVTLRIIYSGLKTTTVYRDEVIVFDHMGPRQPQPSDNLKNG